MKLLVVFMLAAFPLSCYAGAGCQELQRVIDSAIDPTVSVTKYQEMMIPYDSFVFTMNAVGDMKECFLKQSNETLANVKVMMETIYNSAQCEGY
ncbi:mammaglobin-A-like isoform X2 [Perognathus longimembris pacificus]|uniref:mammaglobin-A-like isoform X2 n=1 Tax=Perognathus longimembris pacificus TaxID=214514 RepID=UPI00201A1D70|nr:mammaglobin-A-like isoform X2 [Perognathus longimembris pacificus]